MVLSHQNWQNCNRSSCSWNVYATIQKIQSDSGCKFGNIRRALMHFFQHFSPLEKFSLDLDVGTVALVVLGGRLRS